MEVTRWKGSSIVVELYETIQLGSDRSQEYTHIVSSFCITKEGNERLGRNEISTSTLLARGWNLVPTFANGGLHDMLHPLWCMAMRRGERWMWLTREALKRFGSSYDEDLCETIQVCIVEDYWISWAKRRSLRWIRGNPLLPLFDQYARDKEN